jgi:hypothetical protein
MLAEKLPLNANGKVDLAQLNQGMVSGEKYAVEAVYENDQLTDFELEPVVQGPSDIVQMAFEEISDGMRESMSSNKLMEILRKREAPTMGELSEAMLGNLDSMNRMHQQAMRNSFSMVGQVFPWISHLTPAQSPELDAMREMMPDIENTMPDVQEMMTNAPVLMEGLTQVMVPAVQQRHVQMLSNMSKMNQMTFELTNRFFEQNRAMAEKWFDIAGR